MLSIDGREYQQEYLPPRGRQLTLMLIRSPYITLQTSNLLGKRKKKLLPNYLPLAPVSLTRSHDLYGQLDLAVRRRGCDFILANTVEAALFPFLTPWHEGHPCSFTIYGSIFPSCVAFSKRWFFFSSSCLLSILNAQQCRRTTICLSKIFSYMLLIHG